MVLEVWLPDPSPKFQLTLLMDALPLPGNAVKVTGSPAVATLDEEATEKTTVAGPADM